jgi:hypothetical protein
MFRDFVKVDGTLHVPVSVVLSEFWRLSVVQPNSIIFSSYMLLAWVARRVAEGSIPDAGGAGHRPVVSYDIEYNLPAEGVGEVLNVARQRAAIMGEMREALMAGGHGAALRCGRRLCGIEETVQ